MKTRNFLLIIMLLMFMSCGARQENGPLTGSLLWKISGNDLKKPSYILGTLHLKPGTYIDSIAGAKNALKQVEQVVGEMDMANAMDMQMQLMQAMTMPEDTTYEMLYSPDDYRFVSEQIAALLSVGLDNEQLKHIKPIGISVNLALVKLIRMLPGYNPTAEAIDVYVQTTARAEGKTVLGLETAKDQVDALFSSPLQRQADDLLCYLKNADEIDRASIPLLLEAYATANLDTIPSLININDRICLWTQDEKDKLLKDRNNKWLEKLPAIMKEKSSFIAVGAAHLAGEEGLLYRLRQAGYNVSAVKK
jgi:uncharacterized protein YbaP (TraB family)